MNYTGIDIRSKELLCYHALLYRYCETQQRGCSFLGDKFVDETIVLMI